MDGSIELHKAHFYLVLAPRPVGRAWMNAFAARLALAGPVLALDGGNSFDALGIARQVRRQTADLETVLGRLRVARAFTCYQMVAMLSDLPGSPAALLVLDLLVTFCDESVAVVERARLLEQALVHLRRLSVTAPLAVSASTASDADARLPLGHPMRLAAPLPAMLARLEEAADDVLHYTPALDNFVQGRFW